MPLMHGKSEKAFSHNVRAEMDAGKPQKQSLAIAYAMKRKGKKMAEGNLYAQGGGVHAEDDANEKMKGIHTAAYNGGKRPGTSNVGSTLRMREIAADPQGGFHTLKGAQNLLKTAKDEHHQVLGEMRSMKKPNLYAEGGLVDDDDGDLDMVGRIMAKRACYSEGGRVANDDEPIADSEEAQYDVLPEEDDLEFNYTGANSGDEDGGLSEDDMVDRIMMKRKKDRMPRPA